MAASPIEAHTGESIVPRWSSSRLTPVLLVVAGAMLPSPPANAATQLPLRPAAETRLHASVVAPNLAYGQALAASTRTYVAGALGEGAYGAAYVADVTAAGVGNQTRLQPSVQEPGMRFGMGVAASDERVVVGAELDRFCPHDLTVRKEGVFFVFDRRPTGWVETALVRPDPGVYPCGNNWGQWLQVGGDTIATASSYGLRIFELSSGTWTNRWFGAYVDGIQLSTDFAMAEDGSRIAVYRRHSSITVIDRGGDGAWRIRATVPSPYSGNASRRTIAVHRNALAVGVPTANLDADPVQEGEALVLTELPDGNWHRTSFVGRNASASSSTSFGAGVALTEDALFVAAQNFEAGIVFQFSRKTGRAVAEYMSWGGEGAASRVAVSRDKVFSASVYASDGAYNTGAVAVYPRVPVDVTDPLITGAVLPEHHSSGWRATETTVTWACSDTGYGIESCSAPTTLTSEGSHVVEGRAVDVAGNTTSASVTVNIDKTPPVTAHDAPEGWRPGATTVTLTPSDALSGVATTTYRVDGGEPRQGVEAPVTGDGVHTIEFWSTDIAGNAEAPQSVAVSIDSVAPTIAAVPDPAANDAGWNGGAVTVAWHCGDDRSGVASCPEPVTLDAEGVHTVTGTAIDAAGNATTAEYVIRIDETRPTLGAAADRAPGGGGWYLADVTVSWACADALSGVAQCAGTTTLSTEGAGLTVTGTAEDAAGNQATVTSQPFAVDLAAATAAVDPPRISGVGLPVARAVTGTAADSMSGVARVEVQFTPSNRGAALAPVQATCTGCGAGSRSVTWQVPSTSLPRGSYIVRARAYDVAGHSAAWSAGVSMVIVA